MSARSSFALCAAGLLTALTGTACEGSTSSEHDAAPGTDGSGAEAGSGARDSSLPNETDGGPRVLLAPIDDVTVDEEEDLVVHIDAAPDARVFLEGAPPGSVWDEPARTLSFRPDFIQGGRSHEVIVHAAGLATCAREVFTLTVRDTITPREPDVLTETENSYYRFLRVSLVTDDYLDPPALAGRTYEAVLTIPKRASAGAPAPLRIGLHGSGGSAANVASDHSFGIGPSEPIITWWSGQAQSAPEPASGQVNDYSQRRILHLLDWIDRHHPGVDRDAVTVTGQSMGGVGAMWMAARHGRHFAVADGRLAMTSARLLGAGRTRTMTAHWGSPEEALLAEDGRVVWDSYDLSRAVRDAAEAREVFYLVNNAKNDRLTGFEHWIVPSPVTGTTALEALQRHHVGHQVGWDQRDHTTGGPFWDRLDATSVVRRDRSFPAFSRSSADDDAGMVRDDATMSGDDYGVINRYFEWRSEAIVDQFDRYEIPIVLDLEIVSAGPRAPEDDGYDGALPIVADVSIRRAQRFRALPGEEVRWRLVGEDGATREGSVLADDEGIVTVPALPWGITTQTLHLERTQARCWPSS